MKIRNRHIPDRWRDERGATAVFVAISLVMLLGFTALAVDIGHVMVAKNELQNAADAGALAGALELYLDDGTINPNANSIAYTTATANNSDNLAVEVLWNGDNSTSEVQRGHWSYGLKEGGNLVAKSFAAYDGLDAPDLERSTEDLDDDPTFVNAVRVVARRQATPVFTTFAGMFGVDGFEVAAEAVAYIGYAGDLPPGALDQPIAVCKQSIQETDADGNEYYSCNTGRMINSGGNVSTNNTAGWTSFYQGSGVCTGTNASDMNGLICGSGNPDSLAYGEPIATTGGELQSVYNNMKSCWESNSSGGSQPWEMTLPVVDCTGNNVGNCPDLVGAVTVNLLWMTGAGSPNPDTETPTEMANPNAGETDWDYSQTTPDQCTEFRGQVGQPTATALLNLPAGFDDSGRWQGELTYTEGMARWDCFTRHFQLKNADDNYATLAKKSMYFMPDCDAQPPTGGTGGINFGILADRPVLVR